MNKIYASKIYQASTHKDRIRAALEDPTNAQLAMQIADALDEEYEQYAADPSQVGEDSSDLPDSLKGDLGDDFSPEDDLVKVSKNSLPPRPSSSSVAHSMDSLEGPDDLPDMPDSDGPDLDEPDLDSIPGDDSLDTVEEATDVDTKPLEIDEDEIKTILNNNQTTSGVSRIQMKNNEVWIYYNDSINLNNVMTDVIELLNRETSYNIEFNRLARTENAIVFQVLDQEVGK